MILVGIGCDGETIVDSKRNIKKDNIWGLKFNPRQSGSVASRSSVSSIKTKATFGPEHHLIPKHHPNLHPNIIGEEQRIKRKISEVTADEDVEQNEEENEEIEKAGEMKGQAEGKKMIIWQAVLHMLPRLQLITMVCSDDNNSYR